MTNQGHCVVTNPWVRRISVVIGRLTAGPIQREAPIDFTNLHRWAARQPVSLIITIILILHLLPEPLFGGVR